MSAAVWGGLALALALAPLAVAWWVAVGSARRARRARAQLLGVYLKRPEPPSHPPPRPKGFRLGQRGACFTSEGRWYHLPGSCTYCEDRIAGVGFPPALPPVPPPGGWPVSAPPRQR